MDGEGKRERQRANQQKEKAGREHERDRDSEREIGRKRRKGTQYSAESNRAGMVQCDWENNDDKNDGIKSCLQLSVQVTDAYFKMNLCNLYTQTHNNATESILTTVLPSHRYPQHFNQF